MRVPTSRSGSTDADGTSVPDALVGQHLGEYVVRRFIGSGGMGLVYEGEHRTIGRKVAIKFIREELNHGAQARGLLAEARAASAIRHDGIIDIFGFGEQPGIGQYLVMEYLEGRSLGELIQARAPLPLPEACAVLCEVLDALSAAHAVGVIHRDLKPSNILIARQSNGTEHIKVLDFGLAKRSATPEGTAPQTHSDLVVGTPQYMAPEQALCQEVGPRTDLYAVGVIAYELLTGQRPFTGRSPMEIVAHHLKTPPLAPSLLVELPAEADALILQLLAKEPQQRPGSASEVAHRLRALLAPREGSSLSSGKRSGPALAALEPPTATLQPSPASPRPVSEQPPARIPRWRWGAVAGGVVALLAAVGVIMARGPTGPASLSPEPLPVAPSASLSSEPPAAQLLASLSLPTPAVSTQRSEPQPLLAPAAPVPAVTARRAGASSAPTRKTTPVSSPPVAAAPLAALQPPAASSEPPASVLAPAEAPARVPAVQPAATGTLYLVMRGSWADVWVDGQKLGRVPPRHSYTLASGEHELELRNPAFPAYRRTLVISPGGTLQHTADLDARALPPAP
ncbi:MAG TPA: protein kinase [Myxococcaceae bacterium]|nr:protein kinase [Myxococcaceae bacterium]